MALTLQDMDVYRIARYIGHATVDIGSLCASVKVNMWSKKRPIGVNTDEDLTDAIRELHNWGYDITKYTSIKAMMNAARLIGVNKPCWGNVKPSSTYPHYRMHDFIGYDHYAEAPFPWEFAGSGKTIYLGGKLRFYEGDEVLGALTQADFEDANGGESIYGCKVGVAIRKIIANDNTNDPIIRCTFTGNTTDFGQDPDVYDILATRLNVSAPNGGDGDYEACLFFSSVDITLDGQLSEGRFYLLPYSYFTFEFDSSTGISIWGDSVIRNYGGNSSFAFVFHLTQNGEAQTVSGIKVWCLAKSAENTDWSVSGGVYTIPGDTAPSGSTPATVQSVTIGTITTASPSPVPIQFAIDGDDFPDDYLIVCQYSVNGYTYWVEGMIDDEAELGE